ncbi:FixH family protein [Janthinobacterium agaricidamnosum]|uniref:FixH family protein n=1 Tax=Janthinobacterium agaricidamnosum NBRC 102515 = DSM 9628 TaxID=1349767 RepID=W0VF01_9BURK|nr:FixH family protein [Janthinobacterium agaricidamnosum]CDG86028.1 putative uncharacterized protein [Janthinobacterium agaricidamnosum NBRC 102515 = DSM 9628]
MPHSSSNTLPRQPGGAPVLPWYRHRWPWLLMLGPFIVVLAGCYTGWLAFSHQDALVVGDYYKQGKAINQDLRRDRAASALGMATSVTYDAASGRLRGAVSSHGQPYAAAIRLHLAHATLPQQDIRLDVLPDAAGSFSAPLAMLERSRWQVQVENTARDWRLDGSWIWPAQRSVMLRADAHPSRK